MPMTQFYASIQPGSPSKMTSLKTCRKDIKCWMSNNFLRLREGKSEILIGSLNTSVFSDTLANLAPSVKLNSRNLGVIFDFN